jgi:hypothetical protein
LIVFLIVLVFAGFRAMAIKPDTEIKVPCIERIYNEAKEAGELDLFLEMLKSGEIAFPGEEKLTKIFIERLETQWPH